MSKRRRLAPLLLVAAALVAGAALWADYPRETELLLLLGSESRAVREVRLAFLQSGDEMQGVCLRFPEGAPARVYHRAELAPGRYRVAVELRQADGQTRALQREIAVPASKTVRIEAGPEPAR